MQPLHALGRVEEEVKEDHQAPGQAGTATPTGRHSVQFSRPAMNPDPTSASVSRAGSWDVDDRDIATKDRRAGSLFSKLRGLKNSSGTNSHVRSPSGYTVGGDSIDERFATETVPNSTAVHRPQDDEDENSEDADGEQSTGEETAGIPSATKRRRKSRRPEVEPQTAPTTPRVLQFARDGRPGIFSNKPSTPTEGSFRPSFLPRRATMTDIPGDERQGVSEDEGRDRLARQSPWRRGSAWVQGPRGLSYNHARKADQSPDEQRRPRNFRRLTGFGGSGQAPDGSPAGLSPWKHRGERTSSISAAKWRQLKAGLKMLGQRRKVESTIDHAKSAELLAELTAGIPAALMIASMFQRDEHGHKRIPILLEQLKVKITDSKQVDSKSNERHMIFRIELEYGNGLTRMKWVIHRSLRDFANLHGKYRLQVGAQKFIQLKGDEARTKLPRFPKSTFPYLRGIRGLDTDSEDEEELQGDGTGASGGEASVTERASKKKKPNPFLNLKRQFTSATGPQAGDVTGGVAAAVGGVASATASAPARKDPFAERQRRKLELYLQQLIRYLIFRPESNRLCKFLELSALGVRLAAESSYHGKEGHLIIQSGKGVDFRRAWTPSMLKGRHGAKWFLVRHSYVVCVDSPEGMNIYDVFLVDPCFQIRYKKKRLREQNPKDLAKTATESAKHPQHHSLKLQNSERKWKLLAKNERQLHQFEESIRFMCHTTPWSKPNRFESYAPVRPKVFAQWLVDGRDYMWNVSRAISMAKDVIYIHDWWLSPELYMRRPAAISQKWRLDRLLQRKAQEGVKVFVIMYRNINSAIPIDSEYSKFSLLDLHPNVFVQRSPNQIRQNTFFWAHHEKLCLIDHMVAFVGGIDLCFGRWDTPQHSVVDDKLTGFEKSDMPKDADHCQLWPGKDYSNPRVQDFYALDKPYEEMYDRSKVPRMPWHDISMQVVGQPARDLTRHFVQRWNYILRQRKPTRPTPFLLPAPEFVPSDLESLGLDGTCEVQILRSCSTWSIGTPDKTEHSIMNAYVKMIEQSEHFVYIENQFFISSCEVEGTKIENLIGDALVERIVRASQTARDWKAVIVIPLMPGFQNTVDSQDGTSVRLIMQCQYRSICRGETSIFGRLRSQGIEPENFIQFFSLRSWGKIGPAKQLVTEQLYIHAKCMVVDDKIAIIGSANINERSMLGSRDSECAAVVRDTDMLWSVMNGEPYLVGRFPHTLRMRLMREHLGIDVDEIMENEQGQHEEHQNEQWERDMNNFHGKNGDEESDAADRETERQLVASKHQIQDEILARSENMSSFNHDVDWEQGNNPNLKVNKKVTEDNRVMNNVDHKRDVDGDGPDRMNEVAALGLAQGRDSTLVKRNREVLVSHVEPEGKGTLKVPSKSPSPRKSPMRGADTSGINILPPTPEFPRLTSTQLGLTMLSQLPPLPNTDDTDIGGPPNQKSGTHKSTEFVHPLVADMKRPFVDKDCMRDPLNEAFYLDTWQAIAENNTRIYRAVFRCMPDNEVKSWREYKEYAAYSERFAQAQGGSTAKERTQVDGPTASGPPGQPTTSEKLRMLGTIGEKAAEIERSAGDISEKIMHSAHQKNHNDNQPLGKVEDWAAEATEIQAKRLEKEAQQENLDRQGSHGSDSTIDEKTTIANSTETTKDFAPLENTTITRGSTKSQRSQNPPFVGYSEALNMNATNITPGQKRRRRATTRSSRKEFRASDDILSPADAEELLKLVQGHLVAWPYDW